MGNGPGLEDQVMRVAIQSGELPEQARLADSGLPGHRDNLPLPEDHTLPCTIQMLELVTAPHESAEASRRLDRQSRSSRPHRHEAIYVHGPCESFDRGRPQR